MIGKNRLGGRSRASALAADLSIIDRQFAEHLLAHGYAAATMREYQNWLRRAVRWLSARGRSLGDLRRSDVPQVLAMAPKRQDAARPALHQWLAFKGRLASARPASPAWESWIEQFTHYMIAHKALAPDTQRYCRRHAREFLRHVFGGGPAHWRRVRPADIWDCAEACARRLKPTSAKLALSALRIFLRFVQLRGACSEQLRHAVPPIACHGQTTHPATLTDVQCRRFLAAFPRRHPSGQRDLAMALCMMDLGLRGGEVRQLRLANVDWERRRLTVPIIKRGRARCLPLPPRVFTALHAYVHGARPVSLGDHLFVRHSDQVGEPITASGVRGAMRRAYLRAGLSASWCGTHRLRHTFATRLLARGVGFKSLADLMGHRRIDTTFIYTHADSAGLRQLVRPWPL